MTENPSKLLRKLEAFAAYQRGEQHWLVRRILPETVPLERRELRLLPMAFGNLRITLGDPADLAGYSEFYCFHDSVAAWEAADHWDGVGDPEGWIRHHPSCRRRVDGDPATEYIAP